MHGPGLPFSHLFIIHKLIVFILGLGCKIVALSCEDAICFLLALESVVWHPHIDGFSEKRAECSVPECKAWDREGSVCSGRYLPYLQESGWPVVSHNIEGFPSGPPPDSVTFQQHFFFTAVFQEPEKVPVFCELCP